MLEITGFIGLNFHKDEGNHFFHLFIYLLKCCYLKYKIKDENFTKTPREVNYRNVDYKKERDMDSGKGKVLSGKLVT